MLPVHVPVCPHELRQTPVHGALGLRRACPAPWHVHHKKARVSVPNFCLSCNISRQGDDAVFSSVEHVSIRTVEVEVPCLQNVVDVIPFIAESGRELVARCVGIEADFEAEKAGVVFLLDQGPTCQPSAADRFVLKI